MAIWVMAIQFVDFSSGRFKISKIFAYESTCPKNMIEFLVLEKMSKIGHHFSNKVI